MLGKPIQELKEYDELTFPLIEGIEGKSSEILVNITEAYLIINTTKIKLPILLNTYLKKEHTVLVTKKLKELKSVLNENNHL